MRVRRRAFVGVLFAVLCALALLGIVLQAVGITRKTTAS